MTKKDSISLNHGHKRGKHKVIVKVPAGNRIQRLMVMVYAAAVDESDSSGRIKLYISLVLCKRGGGNVT